MIETATLVVGLLVAWTIIVRRIWEPDKPEGWAVFLRGKLKPIAVAFVVLGLGVLPWTWYEVQDRQDQGRFTRAVESFQGAYPQGQLTDIVRLDDTWLYTYMNDGQNHVVLRVGEDWLSINRRD